MKKSGHGKNNKMKMKKKKEKKFRKLKKEKKFRKLKKMETKIIELESTNRKKIYEKNLA